jgi:nicotinamidase-related amidase
MLELQTQGKTGSTAVFVIDMQSKEGGTLRDGETAYNDHSVIDNQVSVLEAAAAYGMHVVEIRISTTLNAQSDDGEQTRVLHNDPTLPKLATAMKQSKKDKFVSIAKPFYNSFQGTSLEEDLVERGIERVIMMGFDANLCVLNTIFGTPASHAYKKEGKVDVPYLPGLLDRGIDVLTSRVVLASSNGARLMPCYGMTS